MEFSLLYPQNVEYKVNKLTDEAINDLSIDFLVDNLTDKSKERGHIYSLLTKVTDNHEVISYRRDVFEDFLRFPKLREAMEELVARLADLKDIVRFQKDQEGPSLWSLVNRLREIDEYVSCITMIKDTLEHLAIQSEGMLTLKKIVTDIYKETPWRTVAALTGALIYVLAPIDMIFDFIPIVGYIDDAFVIGLALELAKPDLEKYRAWKTERSR